jgi:hypothetical protein
MRNLLLCSALALSVLGFGRAAHANPANPADPDYMMMPPEHHTAQALSKARALCGKNAARSGYAGDQFVIQTCIDKNAWRFDCR